MEAQSLLYAFVSHTVQNEATDLHLCVGSEPLMRRNGLLETIEGYPRLTIEHMEELVDQMLPKEKREILSRNHVLDYSFSLSGLGRFRSNVYSQRGTFAVAIRALPFEIPDLSSLGLPSVLETFSHKSRGLFLATGATGSGKSTTLASLIDRINSQFRYHIITIEDPIEYLHRHKKSLVTQREIGQDAGSFAEALRSALREDPDVIMVGEMRDPETISIALTAAETGHLVFSTMHTMGAAKSIDRIIDAFPPGQQNQVKTQLATALEGVISQQLIPRADGNGLAAASEIMIINSAIRNLIREGKHYQINSIIQNSKAQGMQLLEDNLAQLVHEGIITMEEAQWRAQDVSLLNQLLNRR